MSAQAPEDYNPEVAQKADTEHKDDTAALETAKKRPRDIGGARQRATVSCIVLRMLRCLTMYLMYRRAWTLLPQQRRTKLLVRKTRKTKTRKPSKVVRSSVNPWTPGKPREKSLGRVSTPWTLLSSTYGLSKQYHLLHFFRRPQPGPESSSPQSAISVVGVLAHW